jgi:hypothetical protein
MVDQRLRLVTTQAQPEDVANIEHESHFGYARCLVWGLVFEAVMVIAGLLCWELRLRSW